MSHSYESPTVIELQGTFRENVNKGGNWLDPRLNLKMVLDQVKRYGQLDAVQELGKSNATAVRLRNVANRFYLERKFHDALTCYNESICYAEVDSDQLGIGYANRSAVYFEMEEYEFALYNIDLARKHKYPEKLMPKLLARKLNCQQKIANGHSKGTVPCPRMDINVDTNPRIPFLADGIGMNYSHKFGRGLVAEKDFNPGDVILNEKLEMCGVNFDLSYRHCNQCGDEFNHSLIPCPTCTFYMFCGQECRELNWKLYHRFECGVATKLCSVEAKIGILFARLFFYGLTQFEDDLQAMMNYCEPEVTFASNPLELDFTNLNRLELFKALHNVKPRIDIDIDIPMKSVVTSHYVAFLKNPLVSSIIRTVAHRRFFLQSLSKYFRLTTGLMTPGVNQQGQIVYVIRPIGSLINHSCDPNATMNLESNSVKVMLLRPVRKGEQIFTAIGSCWWIEGPKEFHFKCQCVVCDQGPAGRKWRELKERRLPQKALDDLLSLQKIVNGSWTDMATKLNETQRFVKQYAHLHPQGPEFGYVLRSYQFNLWDADREQNMTLNRAKLQDIYVEP